MSEMNLNASGNDISAENNTAEAGTTQTGTAQSGMAQSVTVSVKPAKSETEHTTRMKKNFRFFGPAAFLYAVLYAFCMYKNSSGIAFPFFMAGSLLYLCLCLSKLEISLKKGSVFYMTGIMLLAVSTFCTDDLKIISLIMTGIFLLMMSLLLKQFYDTSKWRLGKYLLNMIVLVFASLGEIYRPFADLAACLKENKSSRNRKVWSVVLGAVAAVPLLLIVAALLSSADAVFRQMTNEFYDWIQPGNIFNVVFRITFLFFASYLLLAFLCRHTLSEKVTDNRKGEPILALTITSLLSVLYILFSGIQIFGLFLQKMALPAGYTYAEYAREGFFQLLFVSILNLIIVLCSLSFFKESKVLKIVLTIMSFCTFVMIASSAVRMLIYIGSYKLTFLRIFVLWALAVLFVLFVGVVINIFREKFPLFRYSAAVITVLYLVLSFSHPDYIIARVNLADAPKTMEEALAEAETGYREDDYYYLSRLSADAAPVLIPYLDGLGYDLTLYQEENMMDIAFDEETGRWFSRHSAEGFGWYYLDGIKYRLDRMSFRTYNISRHMAGMMIERVK